MRFEQLAAREQQRILAYRALNRALKRGDLVRPETCDECNLAPEFGRIEGHHVDHAEPLVVDWLCSLCHGKRKIEAAVSRSLEAGEWTTVVSKARHHGVTVSAVVLDLLRVWALSPQN